MFSAMTTRRGLLRRVIGIGEIDPEATTLAQSALGASA
jgi:hypothetical protein